MSLKLGVGCSASALGRDREDSHRASASSNDLERRGDHDRTSRRQLVQIPQAGEPEFPCPVHRRVIREGRVEPTRLPRVGAHGLHADAEHVAILCQ